MKTGFVMAAFGAVMTLGSCRGEKPVDRRALTRLLGTVDDNAAERFRETCAGHYSSLVDTDDGHVRGYNCYTPSSDGKTATSAGVTLFKNRGVWAVDVSAYTYVEALQTYERSIAPLLSEPYRETFRVGILDRSTKSQIEVPGGQITKDVVLGNRGLRAITWSVFTVDPVDDDL